MTAFADIADLPEDARIAMIGETAARGDVGVIGFIVETNEKADRYIQKLTERFRIRLIGRGPGPIKNSILVRIGPLGH